MSSKLAQDDQISINDAKLVVHNNSEEMAEIVFSRALNYLEWTDISNCALVCKGWHRYIFGPLMSNPGFSRAFKAKFTDEDKLIQFYLKRAIQDDKAHEQCLLLVLESQMLLRELAEYKKPEPEGGAMLADIREQLAKLNFSDDDEADLVAKIQKLRTELVQAFARNDNIEKETKVIENTVGLLIQHRTSIYQVDRQKKKKHAVQPAILDADIPQLHKDHKLREQYSNLFYLIRTEPKYIAKLSYVLPPNSKERDNFANIVILRLYANAFSPLEEFLLLELLAEALTREVSVADTIDEFVTSESVVSRMIITYNTRKDGKKYVKDNLEALILQLAKSGETFGTIGPGAGTASDSSIAALTKYCELFYKKILSTRDLLPYGFRYLCKHIQKEIQKRFQNNPKQLKLMWRAVGYYVFYRFVGTVIIRPDFFGITDPDNLTSRDECAYNLVAISKVLKTLFMLSEETTGPYVDMNEWILARHEEVKEYIKDVIDVQDAEDKLSVNKYAQLARKEKATIVIPLADICQIHKWLNDNKKEIVENSQDPLCIILDDIGRTRSCPATDSTEVQLVLENRFPPILNKLETKANLKTETISDAIKVLRKIPGFSGDTFLEIFVRMKLHCKKVGEDDLANEVNQVIANLQNLAKYGLVSPKDGFNSFLKDISNEIQQRQARRAEHMRELERLKLAIGELDEAKKFMESKKHDFEGMLDAIRKSQVHDTRTKKFKYKELEKQKVVADSQIPPAQQSKVIFEITHSSAEIFQIKGKIKGIPQFQRNFSLELSDLLNAKENGQNTFDTDKGLELWVDSTLLFLNKNFYAKNK